MYGVDYSINHTGPGVFVLRGPYVVQWASIRDSVF